MKEFKYNIQGFQYKVEIINEQKNLIELEVNGTPYTVQIERPEKSKLITTKPAAAPVTVPFHRGFHFCPSVFPVAIHVN